MTGSSAPANRQVTVRPMAPAEVMEVAAILKYYASRAVLLWREPEEIREHLHTFLVANREDGKVLGCVALQDFGSGLYEIRSLAVHHDCDGQGIGSALIRGAVAKARQQQGREVFALTRKVAFFERFGFQEESRDRFPQKVWRDCRRCPKRDRCDEVAVAIRLTAANSCTDGD